jgi:hypothetical protein
MSHNQYLTTEDPLEGDVDRFVHPDETRTNEQIAHDERYAVEPWDDIDEDVGITEAEFEEEPTNPHVLTLEKSIKERALASGMSQSDLDTADAAVFTLKDAEGNPTDVLKVSISHYKGMYSRPGVQGFEISPIDGPKDEYGRDTKFVRGSFWGSLQSSNPGAFSMTYAGNAEQVRQYAIDAMQPEVLAQAEMQLHVPVPEEQ